MHNQRKVYGTWAKDIGECLMRLTLTLITYDKDYHGDYDDAKKIARSFDGRYFSLLAGRTNLPKIPCGSLFTQAHKATEFEQYFKDLKNENL